ncbi:MAG: hypothetical protein ACE145_01165 [Terriglobia bacterium]
MKRQLLCAAAILLLAFRATAGDTRPILGAKVYRPVATPQAIVAFAKSVGLNTLFVGDELGTSLPFREGCRAAGLKYFLIIRTFNDPEAAERDPSLVSVSRDGKPGRRGDDAMICPARADFRRAKLERIRGAIDRLKPDGITLDYFRFFIYWEGVDPKTGPVNFPAFCFDPSCLQAFIDSGGVKVRHAAVSDLLEKNRPLIDEIWQEHRDAWYAWRIRRIEENAHEMTGFIRGEYPGLPIVLHAVPWARDEFGHARERIVGQDFRLLAPYFDYVSPMAYSALTRRGPGWVEKLNQSLLTEIPANKLLPSIEVGPDGPQFPPMTASHYESDLKAALAFKNGVVLYHLELLMNDPGKRELTERAFTSYWKSSSAR